MILLDTDHFTVLTHTAYSGHESLAAKLKQSTEPVCLPIIVAEESLRGWLQQIHAARGEGQLIDAYDRLSDLIQALPRWRIMRWNEAAAVEFARLRKAGVRIPTLDLRIASQAVSLGSLLLTRNARDFGRVPGLSYESWLD